MTKTIDGGPAFPRVMGTFDMPGMSLRDYFAGKALQAILSHKKNILALACNTGGPKDLAEDCYVMADAMLCVRKNISKPEVPA